MASLNKTSKSKSKMSNDGIVEDNIIALKKANNKNRNSLAQAAEVRAAKVKASKPLTAMSSVQESSAGAVQNKSRIHRHFSRYRPFNKDAAAAQSTVKIPSVWKITKMSAEILKQNWKLFTGIVAIHTVLTLIFVRGFDSAGNLEVVQNIFGEDINRITESFIILTSLVAATSNSPNPVAGLYQTIFGVVISLALIWALRQVVGGQVKLRIRDAFYKGMYPLVPFVLVLVVISLQTLPFLLGATVYAAVNSNQAAVSLFEQAIWVLFFFLTALISLYFVTSSIIALYIAALPDMTPLEALRSAKELVRYRRWTIMRKMVFMLILLLVITACIMIPAILLMPPLVSWLYFVITMLMLPLAHAYLYTLYRELLH